MQVPATSRTIGLFWLSLLISGCPSVSTPHYHWGNYEQIIHDIYVSPGNADPVQQIDKLTTDIQQAQNSGKPVPPGVYAHLGFIYATQGKIADSQAAFAEEKTLFPESSIFIDGMVKRAAAEQNHAPR